MFAEFEERQFEAALNGELADPAWLVFVPGQVFEGVLGIDAAFHSRHPFFWRWQGRPFPWPPGVPLEAELWQMVEDSLARFPPLLCHVFLQHKRPEFMIRSNSGQWSFWNSPYYRFETMTHQQATLARLEAAVGGDGVVLYSAPAFHTLTELWRHAQTRRLVENFNFAQPSRLTGHTVYTYVRAGTVGKANPNGEGIESLDPRSTINRIREHPQGNVDAKQFILKTAQVVRSVVAHDKGELRDAFDKIVAEVGESQSRLRHAFHVLSVFCYVYAVSWSLPSRAV